MEGISDSLIIGYDLGGGDVACLTVARRHGRGYEVINQIYGAEAEKTYETLSKKKYENQDNKCECWKCEKESCSYKDKYQRLPRTLPGALGLCPKLKK